MGGVVFTDLTKIHIEDMDENLDPTIVSFLTNTAGSENAVVILNAYIYRTYKFHRDNKPRKI